jgi:hypothetical protein
MAIDDEHTAFEVERGKAERQLLNSIERPIRDGPDDPQKAPDPQLQHELDSFTAALEHARRDERYATAMLATVQARDRRRAERATREGPSTLARSPALNVPAEVAQHFIADRDGRVYRERDTPNRIAFADLGVSLRTQSDEGATAGALVRIAEYRGWRGVEARGSEAFRREIFMEATARGLRAAGYAPTGRDWAAVRVRAEDYARTRAITPAMQRVADVEGLPPRAALEAHPQLAGALVAAKIARDVSRDLPLASRAAVEDTMRLAIAARLGRGEISRAVSVRVPEGEVLEFGCAPYRFDADGAESFFVRYRRDDGRIREAWGKELERELQALGVKPGMRVRMQLADARTVAARLGADGRLLGSEPVPTHRTRWNVQVLERVKTQEREC